jgi:ferredoxin-thioredoxin reductase catalytic subunit
MPDEIDSLYEKLDSEAESGGYHLNPDSEFTRELVKSLLINENRYGYWACPCRLASGDKMKDLDIICPCDYRDPDLQDYGTCYCALYVSTDIKEGRKKASSIPERRPQESLRLQNRKLSEGNISGKLPYPVWRCRVCGYLCARETPPEICPVCKAKKDRFERFM